MIEVLKKLNEVYKLPVIVSTHPRTSNMLKEKGIVLSEAIRFLKPFGFTDYINLQMNARVVLSDSGTISEESSILDFPALNIREAHERPEAMEEAAVMMSGLQPERVLQCIADLDSGNSKRVLVRDYSMPNVSDKVVKIILSYTDYVKRVVWSES